MSIHTDIPELIRLWPGLPAAILRIQGGPQADLVTGGAGPAPTPPLDVTASETISRLVADVYGISTAAARALAEHEPARSPEQRLIHLPRQHDRLHGLGEEQHARRIAAAAHSWLADARRLIGLSHPDRRLGQYCPAHDDPLVELVTPGDQGHLSLDGKTIDWQHVAAVRCRHCRTLWTPDRYLDLEIQLEAADRRRVAAEQQAAA